MTTPECTRLLDWVDARPAPGTGPDAAILIAAFDRLPAVAEADLIGEWDGGAFGTRHPTEAEMAKIRWVGKSIRSRDDVDPIVCLDTHHRRVASDIMGRAMIREVVWNGVVSAAMIYDRQPVIDYFRRIDARTLMGLMTRRGWETPLPFWLQQQ